MQVFTIRRASYGLGKFGKTGYLLYVEKYVNNQLMYQSITSWDKYKTIAQAKAEATRINNNQAVNVCLE